VSRRAWLLFAAMGVLWGIPYLLIKVADRSLAPATLVLGRTGLGALLLLPLAIGRGELRPVLRCWPWLLAFTAVEIGIPWYLLSDAERHLSSSLSGLLVAAVPLAASVIAVVTASEHRPRPAQAAGLLAGLAGVALLAGFEVSGTGWVGVGEVGAVVIGYATGPAILSRKLGHLPGIGVVAAALTACALAYLPAGLLDAPAHLPPGRELAAVAVLGAVCTAAAFCVFFALIAEAGPVRPMVFTYVNPLVAVALGVVFLHETAGWATAAGAVLILAGSLVATGRVGRRRAPAPELEGAPAAGPG
jgi:drug/metabolite transporter (DMT)-like permease